MIRQNTYARVTPSGDWFVYLKRRGPMNVEDLLDALDYDRQAVRRATNIAIVGVSLAAGALVGLVGLSLLVLSR